MRERYLALPDAVTIRDREVEIQYDVEELPDGTTRGVARLRLPEKLARTLTEAELPALDRPLRFVVPRGQRGSVRAATLDELQELLDRPWTDDELDATRRRRDERRARKVAEREERRMREMRRDFRGARERSRERSRGRRRRPY